MDQEYSKKKRKQDVYNEKIGSIVKSYRLNKDLVKHFKIACDKAGISQSAQLTKMMTEFINENKEIKSYRFHRL